MDTRGGMKVTDKEKFEEIKWMFDMYRELSESEEEWLIKKVEQFEKALNEIANGQNDVMTFNRLKMIRIAKSTLEEE
jgi:hypothetical protein